MRSHPFLELTAKSFHPVSRIYTSPCQDDVSKVWKWRDTLPNIEVNASALRYGFFFFFQFVTLPPGRNAVEVGNHFCPLSVQVWGHATDAVKHWCRLCKQYHYVCDSIIIINGTAPFPPNSMPPPTATLERYIPYWVSVEDIFFSDCGKIGGLSGGKRSKQTEQFAASSKAGVSLCPLSRARAFYDQHLCTRHVKNKSNATWGNRFTGGWFKSRWKRWNGPKNCFGIGISCSMFSFHWLPGQNGNSGWIFFFLMYVCSGFCSMSV